MDVRVAIVGAGFAGLGMAIALTRSGELDFVLAATINGIASGLRNTG